MPEVVPGSLLRLEVEVSCLGREANFGMFLSVRMYAPGFCWVVFEFQDVLAESGLRICYFLPVILLSGFDVTLRKDFRNPI